MGSGLVTRVALSLRTWSKVAMLLGVVALVSVWVISTGAYSSVELARDANLDVSNENGLVGIDAATTVTVGERSTLVTLTNNMDERVTATVELIDWRSGQLFADDRVRDRTITVTLGAGESQTIELLANDRRSTIRYTVSVEGESVNIDFGQQTVTVKTPDGG